MAALDVLDNALSWETERQNQLLQQAIEQRRHKATQQITDSIPSNPEIGVSPLQAGMSDPMTARGGQEQWRDLVRLLPDMRSALIPFDDTIDTATWSKPFSLPKADIDPWLSFLAGYQRSRLFLSGAAVSDEASSPKPVLDPAVRAFLQLRGVDSRFILEPPVQINRQVEYCSLERDLQGSQDPTLVRMLLREAHETHQMQLAKALERGRELGDELYDAMMGEGHANLIKAWQRIHQRKPTVDELHMMLTSGHIKRQARVASRPPFVDADDDNAELYLPLPKPVMAPPMTPAANSASTADKSVSTAGPEAKESADIQRNAREMSEAIKPAPMRKVLWYLLHAVAATSSVAAVYAWVR